MVPSVDSSPCCSADEFQATLSWLSPPLGLSGKVGRQGCQETSDSAIWPIRRQNVLNLKQPQELNLFFLRPLLAVECSVKMSSSFGGGRRGGFTASDDSWEPWEMSLRDEKRGGETAPVCPGPKFRVQRWRLTMRGPCLPSAPLQGHDGEAQTLAPPTVSSLPSSNPPASASCRASYTDQERLCGQIRSPVATTSHTSCITVPPPSPFISRSVVAPLAAPVLDPVVRHPGHQPRPLKTQTYPLKDSTAHLHTTNDPSSLPTPFSLQVPDFF